MFCKSCGTQLNENEKFCPNCGAPIEAPAPVAAPAAESVVTTAPVSNDPSLPSPGSILGFGIAALVCCSLGILGIIFGAIGKNKANAVLSAGGSLGGQGRAGYIMSKIGFIIGIVFTVVWAIYIIVLIAAIGSQF